MNKTSGSLDKGGVAVPQMKGLLFKDNLFYYSPKTGRIVKTSEDISEGSIQPEEFQFRFGFNREEVNTKLNSQLEVLILEGTQKCNLRCGYCIFGGGYLGERTHQPFDMDLNTARKAIEFFLEHSQDTYPIRGISFYGGEPLLNFDVIRKTIEEYNDSEKLMFSISTNGLLLEKYARFLKKNKVFVAVSVDGPKEVHDRYRVTSGRKPTFDKIMRGIKAFGKKRLSFSATITNPTDFDRSYEFFRDNYPYNSVRIEFVKGNDLANCEDKRLSISENKLELMLGDYRKYISDGKKVPRVLSFIFDDIFCRIMSRSEYHEDEVIRHNKTCIPGARKLFVNQRGIFYVCEKLGYSPYEIGNVNVGIDRDKVENLINDIDNTANRYCSKCNISQICNVCIPVSELRQGEKSEKRLMEYCHIKRKSMKTYLTFYVDLIDELGEKFKSHLSREYM